jgi:hypothetical protein
MNGQGQEHIRLDGSAFTGKRAIILDCESVFGVPLTDAITLDYRGDGNNAWIFLPDITVSDDLLQDIHEGAVLSPSHIRSLAGARFLVTTTSPPRPLRIPTGQYKAIILLDYSNSIDGKIMEVFIGREFSPAKRSNTSDTPLPGLRLASGTLDVDTDPQNSVITINDTAGAIDFEALGVQGGDTVTIYGRNHNLVIANIVGASGVNLTFDNTADNVRQDDDAIGTLYTVANQAAFGTDADNWLDATIVITQP